MWVLRHLYLVKVGVQMFIWLLVHGIWLDITVSLQWAWLKLFKLELAKILHHAVTFFVTQVHMLTLRFGGCTSEFSDRGGGEVNCCFPPSRWYRPLVNSFRGSCWIWFSHDSEIIKASVCVIRLSLRLWQIAQTSALIILAIMLNLIQ